MASNDKKKKPASPLMYIIVAIMAAVLIYQNIVPTNMAAVYDNNVNDAVQITCTRVGGTNESSSFVTEDPEKIEALINWGENKKMRIRSLADGISAVGAEVIKYNFAIKQKDGTYQQFVIDSRGYFHVAAEIYKFAGNIEELCSQLDDILLSWQDEKNN